MSGSELPHTSEAIAMWTLSPRTTELLAQLRRRDLSKSWLGRRRREAEMAELLARLAESGESAVLPHIGRFLLARGETVREAARSAVTWLVAAMTTNELLKLESCRRWSLGRQYDSRPDALFRELFGDREPGAGGSSEVAVLGLLSIHPNGYIREPAVRRLAGISTADALPFLLLRLNDWVDPIADAAEAAVLPRMRELAADEVVRQLPIMFRLAGGRRHSHQAVVDAGMEVVMAPQHDELLRRILANPQNDEQRLIADYARWRSGEYSARVARHGIYSGDPVVRLRCLSLAAASCDPAERRTLAATMRTDSSLPVRRAACLVLAEADPQAAEDLWRTVLLDRSRTLRELAVSSLGNLGVSRADVAKFYRDRIRQYPNEYSSICGLSETGDESDLDFFRGVMRHPVPRFRAAAIKGLSRIGGEAVAAEILPLLYDNSPRVSREACEAVEERMQYLEPEPLVEAALHSPLSHVRKNAVRLLAALGKWRSTPWLIRIAATGGDDAALAAAERLVRQHSPPGSNRNFSRPNPDERKAIDHALNAYSKCLDPKVLAVLSSSLKSL